MEKLICGHLQRGFSFLMTLVFHKQAVVPINHQRRPQQIMVTWLELVWNLFSPYAAVVTLHEVKDKMK